MKDLIGDTAVLGWNVLEGVFIIFNPEYKICDGWEKGSEISI
jgi:hypothetical protein